jgi:signal recognition particle subunit SRP54|tara:strand:+ start:332 stop:1660 length:1329 start_codon:yes stop_codon:yes gene_type:complete
MQMFGQITEQFQTIFKNIRGLGKITDKNINDSVRQVRRALIDADVNFKVVKSFVADVEEKAQGTKVLKSIKPGQQFIKIIRDELVSLLGSKDTGLNLNYDPAVVLLTGLQGAGKTTTAGKLALKLKEEGRSVLLVAADVYRPAAIKQLIKLGRQVDVPVFTGDTNDDPLKICRDAIEKARSLKNNVVILDTAGRLHIDSNMMEEIQSIAHYTQPSEILFVADGMTGQDAVRSALSFHEAVPLSGVVLTKMDGDTRGGAAFSIKNVIGVPIKFIGTSESITGLEKFSPDRIADRILGFGDVVSLVEKAEKIFDEKNAQEIKNKISNNSFDLNDFKIQLQQLKNMGPIGELMGMMPGMNSKTLKQLNMDDRQINWTEAIINSMTENERKDPNSMNGSRRLRVSKGSGRPVQEVNALLKQFDQMKKMMKKMKNFKNTNIPFMGNM